MNRQIRITTGKIHVTATLVDGETANLVWHALPIESVDETWGGEMYFWTPVATALSADACDVQEIGTVAYWPPGQALCLFFGPTPMSLEQEPRAASPVNQVGTIGGNPSILKSVCSGYAVRVERI